MNWVIDIALLLVLAITIAIYARQGFVKSFIGFFKFGLALLISALLAPLVGTLIYNAFMYNSIHSSVYGWLSNLNINATMEDLANNLPDLITSMLKNVGVDIDSILAEYQGQEITEALIDNVSHSIASPIASFVSNSIAFILTFILAIIGLTILAHVLNTICKLPILKQANTILGIVMGVVCGIVNVFIAVSLITILLKLFGNESSGITVETMKNSTFFYNFVSNLNLMELINNSLTKIKSK